jgi:hypothetical protein
MIATNLSAPANSNAALSRYAQPLMGWRPSRSMRRDPLTHAVMPARTVAECGAVVMVIGQPWPQPGAGTPPSQCSVCAQAVDGLWARLGLTPDAH